MNHKKYILAFDPSGSFREGKGTTGWVIMDNTERLLDRGNISAKFYNCAEEYWNDHLEMIQEFHDRFGSEGVVVMENYILYRDKSLNQTNSQMETCRLLGAMTWKCWQLTQDYSLQLAADVKHRWSDELLEREGIISRDKRNRNRYIHCQSGLAVDLVHTRDALRHALHFIVCKNNSDRPKPPKFERSTPLSNYDKTPRIKDHYNAKRKKGYFDVPR